MSDAVRPKVSGRARAIQLPAAGWKRRGEKLIRGEWERRRGIRWSFVHRPRGPSPLVADGRLNTKGLGVLLGPKPAGARHRAGHPAGAAGQAAQAA